MMDSINSVQSFILFKFAVQREGAGKWSTLFYFGHL